MSRKDEIIAMLIKHDCMTRLNDKKYKVIAAEIEKLFEGENKVKHGIYTIKLTKKQMNLIKKNLVAIKYFGDHHIGELFQSILEQTKRTTKNIS